MTEVEWLACDDPIRLFNLLVGHEARQWSTTPWGCHSQLISDRKLRLFGIACCIASKIGSMSDWQHYEDHGVGYVDQEWARRWATPRQSLFRRGGPEDAITQATKADLLREIVGNPYRSVALPTARRKCWSCDGYGTHLGAGPDRGNPTCDECGGSGEMVTTCSWLTWNDGVVAKMARCIYDERALDRLPILADALEDAGCDNDEMLNHFRGPGPHFRGCWALDLLLELN